MNYDIFNSGTNFDFIIIEQIHTGSCKHVQSILGNQIEKYLTLVLLRYVKIL